EGLPAGAQVTGVLKMPGFAQSGLKVLLGEGALAVSGEETLLVDFDVAQSFGKEAGRSGKWVMRPVIRAARLESAAGLTVTLSLGEGVVLPEIAGTLLTLAGFEATLTPAGGGDARTAAFADADGDGAFEADFRFLLPGAYHLCLTCPAGLSFGTAEALPLAVTVAAGSAAEASLTPISAV